MSASKEGARLHRQASRRREQKGERHRETERVSRWGSEGAWDDWPSDSVGKYLGEWGSVRVWSLPVLQHLRSLLILLPVLPLILVLRRLSVLLCRSRRRWLEEGGGRRPVSSAGGCSCQKTAGVEARFGTGIFARSQHRGRSRKMPPKQAVSSFARMNTIEGHILAKAKPLNWSTPTMLQRVLCRDETEIMFHVTGKALQQFEALEEYRAYVFQVPGTCVKPNKSQDKNGVGGEKMIRITKEIGIQLSTEAWPLKVPYAPIALSNLNQQPVGTFVDIVAYAVDVPGEVREAGLRKRDLELANEEHVVVLELLEEKMNIQVQKGDLVAVRGAKVSEYQGARSLSTSYLSFIEVRPTGLAPGMMGTKPEDGSPLRKAMRMTAAAPLSLADLSIRMQRLSYDVLNPGTGDLQKAPTQVNFHTSAHVKPFEADIFDKDPPYYEANGVLRLKVKGTLLNNGTEVPVTFWPDAARELFKTDAGTLQGLWEQCESEEGRQRLLDTLNAHVAKLYMMQGAMKPWTHGKDGGKVSIQVNINNAEAAGE